MILNILLDILFIGNLLDLLSSIFKSQFFFSRHALKFQHFCLQLFYISYIIFTNFHCLGISCTSRYLFGLINSLAQQFFLLHYGQYVFRFPNIRVGHFSHLPFSKWFF